MDFRNFQYLTFDCYGTLIDWESGILNAFRPLLRKHQIGIKDDEVLTIYAELEAQAEAGPYQRYRDILAGIVAGFGTRFRFQPTPGECASLAESVANWLPFPDTIAALRSLQGHYRLAVLSNIDDDLFERTAARLEIKFDEVITAQQAGAYKPSTRIFEAAARRIGVPKSAWLHVAESRYHDIAPAKALGIHSVWVNRRYNKAGGGASGQGAAEPDLEVRDLKTLADMAEAEAGV